MPFGTELSIKNGKKPNFFVKNVIFCEKNEEKLLKYHKKYGIIMIPRKIKQKEGILP